MTRPLPDRLAGDGLAPLWPRCWRALARAGPGGWPAVVIRVPTGDDAHRRAVAGLLGRPVRAGTATVGVALGELDDVIRRTGDGWDLLAVAEAVGGPLPDRAGAAAARRAAIDDALAEARRSGPSDPWFPAWLDSLATDGTAARLHTRQELPLLVVAARLLARLPAAEVPLPVLAAREAGDPKALAGGSLPGLVLRALATRLGEPAPRSAGERRALWESAGVVPDDLASQALVLNLPVGGRALGEWLAGARREGLPFRVTLHQLGRSAVDVIEATPVLVCENPAVLRAAAERWGSSAAPLVCTEGRPSVACVRVLDTLAGAGCPLRYHGDFDWPGLRIGADLLCRPGVSPWRFGAVDYEDAVARGARAPAARRPLAGAAAPSPWDPALADAMAGHDVAIYEEDVLDTLLADLQLRG